MFKRNNAFTSRGGWIPYFVFGISFFVTVLTTYVFGNTVHEKDKLRFDTSVSQNHITVEDRIQTYIDLLRATEGLLAASDFVNGSEFKEFVGRLDIQRKYPGIQGIGYTIRLRQDEVPLIIEQMRMKVYLGLICIPIMSVRNTMPFSILSH